MFEKLVKSLFGFCSNDLQFKRPPRLFIKQDSENSKNPLGKTAYYQPNEQSITIYGTGRHCKDMLRSIAHELVHHHQNERGDFDNCGGTEPGYAQNDEHLRNMEKEAYLKGNMLFRDWEDSCKKQMQMEDNNKMKLSELKKIIKETIKDIVEEGWGGSSAGSGRFIGDETAKYKERNPGRNHHIPQRTNADACLKKYPMRGLDYRECLQGLKEADGEQQIEEGDCGSGKREDKKSKKKCPHCDGNAPESECINKPQKKSMKEGEEAVADEAETLEEGEEKGYYDAKEHCEKCCDKPYRAMSAQENYTACMKRYGHGPGMKPSNTAPSGGPQPSDQSYLTPGSRSKNAPSGSIRRNYNESKVMTPEKEKALKENYMGEKRNRLFEKLTKKWTK